MTLASKATRAYISQMDMPSDWEDWWEDLRFVTLDEAKAMECNRCGECCSSLRAPGRGLWSWGGLPKGRHYGLVTLLDERTMKPRAWRTGDDDPRAHNAYDCTALEILDNGTTSCAIFRQPRQPGRCGEFPVYYDSIADDLADGPILLRTEPLHSCTWYLMIVLRDDSAILDWRRKDQRLSWSRLSAPRRRQVYSVIREAEHLRERSDTIPHTR